MKGGGGGEVGREGMEEVKEGREEVNEGSGLIAVLLEPVFDVIAIVVQVVDVHRNLLESFADGTRSRASVMRVIELLHLVVGVNCG